MSFRHKRKLLTERLTRWLPKSIRSNFRAYRKTHCALKIYHGTRGENLPLTIAIQVMGSQTEAILLEQLFDSPAELLTSLSIDFHRIPEYLNQHYPETGILITRDNIYHESLYKLCLLRLPSWIELTLPLNKEVQIWQKKNAYSDIRRRIKKNRLSYQVETAADHLENFYHQQFKPYILDRHGDKAFIADFKTFAEQYTNADILKILDENGTAIAAALLTESGTEIRLCRLGIQGADPGYTRLGAIGAIYYFAANHYSQLQLQTLNFGLCSSFLTDPVTHYKIRLCGRLNPKRKTAHHLMIPLKQTPAVVDFLENNPAIIRNDSNELELLNWNAGNQRSKHPFYKGLPAQTRSIGDKRNFYFH